MSNLQAILKDLEWQMSLETFVMLHRASTSNTDLRRRFGLLAVALDIPTTLVKQAYNSFLPRDSAPVSPLGSVSSMVPGAPGYTTPFPKDCTYCIDPDGNMPQVMMHGDIDDCPSCGRSL